jgi:hypothetical protein
MEDEKKNYISSRNGFFLMFVIVCLQFTDAKIFNIKISEISLILLSIILISKNLKIHKYILWFLLFFTLLFVKTLIQNPFTTFYVNATLPLLKQPYFISISRFVEFFCCIFFAYFASFFLSTMSTEKGLQLIIAILKFQIYIFGPLFFVLYLMYRVGILHFAGENGYLVYDSTPAAGDITFRLRGFFNEGGPFGLFNAYLYILYDWVLKQSKKSDLLGKLIIILIIVLASSKAGYCMMIIFLAIKAYGQINSSKYALILKTVMVPIILVGAASLVYAVSEVYIERSAYIKEVGFDLKSSDATDPNSVMGRVSGMTIAPNILMNNYIVGVGLGNYALVRNNPLYRDYFPEVSVADWDSPGLGGLVDLMIDGGFLFFVFFVFIFYKIYKEVMINQKQLHSLLLSFIFPFFFGVQLYFLYPWFSLGILIFLLKKSKTSDNIEHSKNFQHSA